MAPPPPPPLGRGKEGPQRRSIRTLPTKSSTVVGNEKRQVGLENSVQEGEGGTATNGRVGCNNPSEVLSYVRGLQ